MAESALIGQPPNTPRDLNIVRGLLRHYGAPNADPSLGFFMAPKRPEGVPDGENKQAGLVAGMVIVMLAILIPTVERLRIRLSANNTTFGADDVAIIVAGALAVTYPVIHLVMIGQAHGGTHTWERTYEDYQLLYYYLYTCKTLFYVTVGMIKVSITLFIRRLAATASRKWTIFCDVFLATLVGYTAMALFWNVLNCKPPRMAWDKEYHGSLPENGTCGNLVLNARVISIVHVVQGAILLTSPVFILWKVQMNLAKKIRFFVIWLIGGWSVIGGLLAQINPSQNVDVFFGYDAVLVWTVLDLTMGMIVASLPVLDIHLVRFWKNTGEKLGTAVGVGSGSGSHGGSKGHSRGVVSTNASRSGWDRVGSKNATITSKIERVAAKKDDSESVENMIRDDVEMGIMRTNEVRLSYDLHGNRSRQTTRSEKDSI